MRKAIFWDFYGTLTYPRHLWTHSVLAALGPLAERYGVTDEKLRPFLRSGFPWDPDGEPGLTGEAWWEDRYRCFLAAYRSCGVPEREGRIAAQRARELILSPRSYRVRPDAAAVLAVSIYKGYKNYLLSNNYPEMEEVLEGLYLRQFFTGCIVSGRVGVNKPEERIFRIAERAANFPTLIWMVGDSPSADIAGAKNAGWKTALLAGDGDREGGAPGADVTASTLTELLKRL